MRGRKWVLAPHCAESPTAKVNLFEVVDGYAMPVTFAGGGDAATVMIRNLSQLNKLAAAVIHPGVDGEVRVPADFRNNILTLKVPLVRGRGMVKLTPRK